MLGNGIGANGPPAPVVQGRRDARRRAVPEMRMCSSDSPAPRDILPRRRGFFDVIDLRHGDMLDVLPTLAAESVHSCVTDPPYHLTSVAVKWSEYKAQPGNPKKINGAGVTNTAGGFMGKQWDGGSIAFDPETWRAVLRVLKPGGYLLAFASTRGYHRMVCAIEDAGFVIHPMIAWIFGSGFPKATKFQCPGAEGWRYGMQSLKPAIEPICMAQRPMIGAGTENWLRHGTGGINVDACRVAFVGDDTTASAASAGLGAGRGTYAGPSLHKTVGGVIAPPHTLGRWPANVVLNGSPEVEAAFAAFGNLASGVKRGGNYSRDAGVHEGGQRVDGTACYADTGTASRFFFTACPDVRCGLCGLLCAPNTDTLSECKHANSADQSSLALLNEGDGSARRSAREHLPPEGADKPRRLNEHASSVAGGLLPCHQPTPDTVHPNAPDDLSRKIVQNVRSAATL